MMKKINSNKTNIGRKKIICLIPIRANSKRIKNKNLIKIKNLPLFKYVYNKILNSKKIEKFYFASDNCEKFKKYLKSSRKVEFFNRSKKISKDNSTTEELIDFFSKKIDYDILVLLQVTNPFIKGKLLDDALKKFFHSNYDSMLSVVKSKSFLWKKDKYAFPINYNFYKRKMSQKIKPHYVENGSFYIFKRQNYNKYKNRLHGRIGLYEMPKSSIHEIDDFEDYKIVNKLIN